MLGNMNKPNLSAKAAETHGLLGFVTHCLTENMQALSLVNASVKLEAELLQASGQAALRFDSLLASPVRKLSADQLHSLLNNLMLHVQLFERAGGRLTPKHHLMVHCVQRAVYLGNPSKYTTYRDESLNGVIARIATACHASTFYEVVHRKLAVVHQLNLPQAMH